MLVINWERVLIHEASYFRLNCQGVAKFID